MGGNNSIKKDTSCEHFFCKVVGASTMSSNNKRRRTTTPNNDDDKHITDLPDGLLVGVSSYLAKPSAVLFALSMTADSDQQKETETSKGAIISSIDWNVLDFSDIEKSLAAKLSDDDISKILRSIDAVNNLKVLKLAGCVNITGSGLDLLSSSVAIQQIDMSLVGKHESPTIKSEPKISEDIVIPILDVIISRGGSSLKSKVIRITQEVEGCTEYSDDTVFRQV